MMLYLVRELIRRTSNYFSYTTFCYGRELVSSKSFIIKTGSNTHTHTHTHTHIHKGKKMMLVARIQGKGKGKGK